MNSPWGSSASGTAYGAASVTGKTGGSDSSTGNATSPPGGVGGESGTAGTDDTIVATPSTSGVSVAIGSSQTVSITFTSSDGRSITGFGVSATLSTLPAGWSGPTTFTCKLVMAGSACVLNLTYSPTAADSGSFAVNYVYVDNANLSKAPGGSLTLSYQAIPQNNVVATGMPSGQINALLGAGIQSVSVNFTSDTVNATLDAAITHLNLITDLSALPAGWSSASPGFSCAIVTTGNGCQLILSYDPTASGSGVLTLNYAYMDDSGTSRVGSLNIPYATTASNNVVATSSPGGQINAVQKTGSQAVAIDFNTDDGRPATNLVLTSSLSALPAGWHGGSTSFSCSSVSTGNGCQLGLTYAPTALGSGMLTLAYAYDDDAGNQQTGTLNVPYAATTNDNVVATPSPTGQIDAVVGQGTQNVAVVFSTDDTRVATALQVTTDLTMLPPGWSGPGSFSCTTVSTGSACELGLSYTPTAYTTPGTLAVGYSYVNDAGLSNTGTASVRYAALTDNSVQAAVSPGTSLNETSGSVTTVTIGFTTNDANPATGLSVSGLLSLPAGWSGPGAFTCATVTGSAASCQLTLTYAPTSSAGSATLSLGYGYTNNAGSAGSGNVTIQYSAI